VLAWTQARKLRRERLTIKPGYEFGYMLGANCSDGTVGKNTATASIRTRGSW
jgi:GTP cyclohydrolase I